MCQYYYKRVNVAKKNEAIAQELIVNEVQHEVNKDIIYYDDAVSMLQRTAYRVYPII